MVSLSELEQALKDFLDLEILIKKREKLRKHKRKKERQREQGNNHRYRYRSIGYNSSVLFFVNKEEKCREKQFYSIINGKVSQSPKKKFFLTNEQKFLSYKIKYFKSSTIDITRSQ